MPIYKDIVETVKHNIKTGLYPKGGLLPSEQELCQLFNTSRMTVRKALDELAATGWIYRVKGKGSFVSAFELRRDYTLKGFSQIMAEKGVDFKTRVLRFEEIAADKAAAEKLRIPEGNPVYLLERVRYIFDEAVTIEKLCLNANLFPNFMQFDFSQTSLYNVLETHYGRSLKRVEQRISTTEITGEYAKILFNKSKGTALFVNGVGFDNNAIPIEFETGYYNGNKYHVDVLIQ